MGKNNRERRAAKKKRQRAPSGSGGTGPTRRPFGAGPNPFAGADEQQLHDLVVDQTSMVFWGLITEGTGRIAHPGLGVEVTRYHDELRPPEARAVTERIGEWIDAELPELWARGWMPEDLWQAARRDLRAGEAALLVAVIVEQASRLPSDAPMPGAWRDQLDVLAATTVGVVDADAPGPGGAWFSRCATSAGLAGADLWIAGLMIMRLFVRLPVIEEVLPPPSRWSEKGFMAGAASSSIDDKLLGRVRGLLAKAESTTFTEEADALTAKAQELMARYAIDQVLVERSADQEAPVPKLRRFWLDNPYAEGKSVLVDRVAGANRCSAIYSPGLGFTSVVGFAADLEMVDLLFTSLLVQGSAAVRAAGSVKDPKGHSRTRSFRSTFWLSYAVHIGDRLDSASAHALADAVADHGRSLVPVLVEREQEVQDAMASAFPHVTKRPLRFSNAAGYHAGRLAADQADIGVRDKLDEH